jgi:hypothetical protein
MQMERDILKILTIIAQLPHLQATSHLSEARPVYLICLLLAMSAVTYKLGGSIRNGRRYGTRRIPRRRALRVTFMTALSRPTGLGYPTAMPMNHVGRPSRHRSRKPATWPVYAYSSRPGVSRRHHVFAPSGRALVLLGHLARHLLTLGVG